MLNDLTQKPIHQTFESIRHTDADNNEYWIASELAPLLDYQHWQHFLQVIQKAETACKLSGQKLEHHCAVIDQLIETDANTTPLITNYKLSRYFCYLILQNADPSKPVIANAQTYFALQARKQELQDLAADNFGIATELDYAMFQDHGFKGLHSGTRAKEMSSSERAAYLFFVTQAEDKLRRDNIQGAAQINQTIYAVGEKVRDTIEQLGGLRSEHLPKPDKVK